MKIIGKTRSGKLVDADLPLSILEYRYEFTKQDHYDATCIWTAYGNSYECFIKKEFHARMAGLNFAEMVQTHWDLRKMGKMLLVKEEETYVER